MKFLMIFHEETFRTIEDDSPLLDYQGLEYELEADIIPCVGDLIELSPYFDDNPEDLTPKDFKTTEFIVKARRIWPNSSQIPVIEVIPN